METEHFDLLATVARTFPDRRFVAIGAAALRWHYPSFRGTLDLDLCIAIDRTEHDQAGTMPDGWRRRREIPHRWQAPDGQLVDVIPAADSELVAGEVRWPDGVTMDLTGIDLAMADGDGLRLG